MSTEPTAPDPGEARDPLFLRATPSRVRAAARAAGLGDRATTRAIELVALTPPPAEWRRFLSGALAAFGAMLLLAGGIMFVANNWSRIGRFGKFALVEAAIVATALVAWRKLPAFSGQVALFAASVLVGPLLAIYGQTYQTGADPYGLFATWALLVLPWAVLGRFGANWVLIVLLLDLALGLWFAQVLQPRDLEQSLVYPLLVAVLHAAATIGWEVQLRRARSPIVEGWALRVFALVGLLAVFLPAAIAVFKDADAGPPGLTAVVALILSVIGCLWYYSRERGDRFVWTAAGTAGMAFITVVVARVVFDLLDLGEFGLVVMAGVVVAQITYGLRLYRRSRAT